jgi:hypothetical protein
VGVVICLTLVNVIVAVRGIYTLSKIEHYRQSLQKLLVRLDRIEKEPHP